ncbi:autotransporter domain-containing protein [Bosea vestrisii]|uniref:autotransporter outer membrane beta-barrel domain-containing protein n=1 Tax=Bosea vestrisii TaxID=151416 RepID=UPI0024DF6226|nr:autotransporter domain-containing protein [Bosea vestrisii]WID96448.1 autotransporter domain-containing protein [Bosea vestrisii]
MTLAAGLALVAATSLADAQSVTGTGDLNPGIPAPPLASWNLSGSTLLVGNGGTGSITISSGGSVSSNSGALGFVSGSNGTATVTGAGSSWTNAADILIGLWGTGSLIVADRGGVSSANGSVGLVAGGVGTVTVTGVGSAWTNSGILTVGSSGTGTLTIAAGGSVTSVSGYIGRSAGANGAVTVTGAGSNWRNSGTLSIANNGGTGSLTIAAGGEVRTQTTSMANALASNGTLNLLGDAASGRGVLETNQISKGLGTATLNLNGGILRARADRSNFLSGFSALTIGANGAFFDTNGFVIGVATSFDGSGGLTKQGAGQLSLSGTNTYSGATTVAAGSLDIAGSQAMSAASDYTIASGAGLAINGTLGTVTAGSIAGAGTVQIGSGTTLKAGSSNASTTFSGVISGSGGLDKAGTGQLTLSGANTHVGGTTISDGKLSISADANLGDVSGALTLNGGVLQVTGTALTSLSRSIFFGANGGGFDIADAGNTFIVSQSFSGSGSFEKSGAGTLTLTGANTYTGGTTILGGKLSVSSNGNLGDAAGGLTLVGGTLQVTNSITLARTVTLSGSGGGIEVDAGRGVLWTGAITGTGGLSKSGGGTLALQNTSTYSGDTLVEAGTLVGSSSTAFSASSNFIVSAGATLEVSDVPGIVATVGSLAGAGAVQLGSGATLKAGATNASTIFSGVISGNGALDKTGTGTLTLTGTNTYTGGTTVSGGKLVVNGSITGAVTLSGGALGGSGTVGELAVVSGGTVAPGNSIGTLKVSGNVAFASGSTYQVEVNAAGQSDRIVASGAATLNGGRVEVLAENGNYAASTTYTILTAAGGVTGRFADATSNLVFLEPSLVYDSNNVVLTMTRNATSFGPEGGAAGDSVAATRNQGFIANAAERLGAGNPVYDTLLSGTAAEARAGFDLLSGEAHAQAVSVMIDESRLVRETILNRLRGPLLTAPAGQVAAAFSADLPGRRGAVLMNAPQPRYALWGEAFGGAGNSDADGNAASQSRRTGGALLGADLMLYDAPGSSLKVGVAGGYSQSRFDLDARRSSGKLESGHAALYAGARFGALRLDAGLAYSWSESDIRRQVQIRGFGDSLRLQRPGAVAQGFAELGYGFAFQGFALEPFAQLALIRVSTDAGTEQGGAAALRVLSSEQALGFSTLGLRAEAQIGAMPLFARAMLGWRHGFGELTPQARTAFALGTTPARVFAAPIDRDALTAEAGLDWRISSATALGLTYSAAIGERSRDHALKGRVEMKF